MTDEGVIRAVLPRHGPKVLARLMSVKFETARHWYYKHLSAARRRELALALLAEMDAEDRRRAAVREHLRNMAGQNVEVDGAGGRVGSGKARGQRNGEEVGGVGE